MAQCRLIGRFSPLHGCPSHTPPPLPSAWLCLTTPVLDMPCLKGINDGAEAELATSIPCLQTTSASSAMSEDDDSPKKPAAAVKKDEVAAQANAAQASAQAHLRAEAQPVGKTLTGLQVCWQWHWCLAELHHSLAVVDRCGALHRTWTTPDTRPPQSCTSALGSNCSSIPGLVGVMPGRTGCMLRNEQAVSHLWPLHPCTGHACHASSC